MTILRHKFYFIGAIRMTFNDCTNLPAPQVMFRKICSQGHYIQQLDLTIHELASLVG